MPKQRKKHFRAREHTNDAKVISLLLLLYNLHTLHTSVYLAHNTRAPFRLFFFFCFLILLVIRIYYFYH